MCVCGHVCGHEWSVCVCVHVCVCVCVYDIYICVCVCGHVCVHMECVCVHVCVCVGMHVCVCVTVCVCVCVFMCVCVCAHIFCVRFTNTDYDGKITLISDHNKSKAYAWQDDITQSSPEESNTKSKL